MKCQRQTWKCVQLELSLTQSPSLCLYLESLLLASVLIVLVLLQQNTPTIIVGVDKYYESSNTLICVC